MIATLLCFFSSSLLLLLIPFIFYPSFSHIHFLVEYIHTPPLPFIRTRATRLYRPILHWRGEMGMHSCCYKQKLRKGLWSPEEDEKLFNHITKYGHDCWSSVPKQAGLQRGGKSCRLRWINYLRPDLKRGKFSEQEENLIIKLHSVLGNRWSQIAAQLPGRTDNEIKNLWNSSIKKKLRQHGIDPNTHKPVSMTDTEESKSISELTPPSIPVESASSGDTVIPTKELLIESSSNGRMADSMDYFPLPKLSYSPECSVVLSMNQNPPLWFNQGSKHSNVNHDFNSDPVSNIVQSTPSSIGFKPLDNSSTGWEAGNSSNNSCSSGNSRSEIELQSNVSLLDGSIFQWLYLSADKEAQFHNFHSEHDELKWSEFLNGSLPTSATIQNQSQALYCDIKEESQFNIDGLSTWHNDRHQQHHQLQASGVHGKDIYKISSTFEQV